MIGRTTLAAVLLAFTTVAATACQFTGCGCKGGPGFRGPNGRCVIYKQLDKVSGSPPTSRCIYEQECAHEGSMPNEKGMERYRRSIESIAH